MVIAFYSNEMNLRGIALSTFLYAVENEKILKNKSIIFYNNKNVSNNKKIIFKFKKRFKTIGISNFKNIDEFKTKFKIDYIYTQKGGEKDNWISNKIKTIVHAVYPQRLNQVHGHKYAYISEWASKEFSNNKIPYIPLIVTTDLTTQDLKRQLNIKKNSIVFGCYGGSSSFDLKFVQDAILNLAKSRKDIFFLFLNIEKFCNHPRIKFIKGTSNEIYKKKFINSCDAMIYGRSLGESFGLACGEFALNNKTIFSYKFNRHRSHVYNISNSQLIEYSSYKDIINLLSNFKKKKEKIHSNKYKMCSKHKVMKNFQKVFLNKNEKIRFNLYDYISNFLSHLKIGYFYLRHKFYIIYYKYIERNFIN